MANIDNSKEEINMPAEVKMEKLKELKVGMHFFISYIEL